MFFLSLTLLHILQVSINSKLFSTRFDRSFSQYFSPFTLYNGDVPLREGIVLGTSQGGLQIISIDSGDMEWENLLKDRHEGSLNLLIEIPKKNLLFSCDSVDIRIWDLSQKKLLSKVPITNRLNFIKGYVDPTPATSQIYLLNQGGGIQVFNYIRLTFKDVYIMPTPISFTIQDFTFSEPQTLLIAHSNNRVVAFDIVTSSVIKTFLGNTTPIKGHTRAVNSLAYLKNENKLVTIGGDLLVIVWDFETATPIKQFSGFAARLTSIIYIEGSPYI